MASAGLGGGDSNSSSQNQSTTGYNALPPEIQNVFKDLATQTQGQLDNPNKTAEFTPIGQTAGETQAYNSINQGFTPTAQSLQSTINMQMNPYDQSVIDTINRQAQGQNSQLQQGLSAAGQFGSNRAVLGANDIDLSRLQQIGTFKQGEYNTALQNSLTTIPGLQQSSAQAQLAAGSAQRGLAGQIAQAPTSALAAISQILGVLPTNSGQSTGNSNANAWNFNSSASFSDMRMKENIEPYGVENGWPVYTFNYIGNDKKYIGVMAQEIEPILPEAIGSIGGVKTVHYDMLGVKFREAE